MPQLNPSEEHHVINFSGGRSSGYMLYRELERHQGDLPKNWHVVFANTGKEMPETLDFVQACSDNWSVPITWIEYRYYSERAGGKKDPKNEVVVVDYKSASRAGEPFEQLVHSRKYLPNPVARICTQELKIENLRRYMRRHLGVTEYLPRIGLRFDERHRWAKVLARGDQVKMPLVEEKQSLPDVHKFWKSSNFDLGIDSLMSNCDLCFLKGKIKLINIISRRPEVADWWIEQEKLTTATARHRLLDIRNAQFSKRWSYRDLKRVAAGQIQVLDVGDELSTDTCYCTD